MSVLKSFAVKMLRKILQIFDCLTKFFGNVRRMSHDIRLIHETYVIWLTEFVVDVVHV